MILFTPEEMRRFVVEHKAGDEKLCRVYDTVNHIHGPWCNVQWAYDWWDGSQTAQEMKKGTYGQPKEK